MIKYYNRIKQNLPGEKAEKVVKALQQFFDCPGVATTVWKPKPKSRRNEPKHLPHVAATAVMLIQKNPTLTPAQIADVLMASAGGAVREYSSTLGWGQVNAWEALQSMPSVTAVADVERGEIGR